MCFVSGIDLKKLVIPLTTSLSSSGCSLILSLFSVCVCVCVCVCVLCVCVLCVCVCVCVLCVCVCVCVLCVCVGGGLKQSVYKVTQVGEPGTASYNIMLVETTMLELNKPYSTGQV